MTSFNPRGSYSVSPNDVEASGWVGFILGFLVALLISVLLIVPIVEANCEYEKSVPVIDG